MLDRRSFLSLASGSMLSLMLPATRNASAQTVGTLVEPQFFGMHMVWPVRQPYIQNFPSVPIGAWRAYVPETHWFSLEPRRGEWNFAKMDVAMRLMKARGIEVTYTLGHVPTWASSRPDEKGTYVPGEHAAPRNLSDWQNYVRTVARRYRGQIRCYDLWNEPKITEIDGKRARFSAAHLVELGQTAYQVLREEDPSAKLSTPSFDGGMSGVERMDAYLAAGGSRCADLIAFHFYGLPDQIVEFQAGLRRVLKRHGLEHLPVWNTESGFLIEDPTRPNTHPISNGAFARILPADEAAAWLGRSMAIAASVGVSRFFWFMWDGANMGLTTWVGKRVNAAGKAYGTMATWMIGKQVGALQVDGNVVTCPLVGSGGDVAAALVWSRDYHHMKWTLPPAWKDCRVGLLSGESLNMAGRTTLDLSAGPIRLSLG